MDASVVDQEASLNYLSVAFPFFWHKNMVVSVNYQRLYEFGRSLDYALHMSGPGLDLDQNTRYHQNGFIDAVGLAGAVQLTPVFAPGLP